MVKFEKICKIFPIFYKTQQFMRNVNERLEKHNWDEKECAMMCAILAISAGMRLSNSLNH